VAAFAEIPSLGFESEAAVEIAKAFEGWIETDVLAPMVEPTAHLESFHGGRLHRAPVSEEAGPEAAAASFRRALERQLDSAPYDAVHVFSPIEGKAAADRLGPHVALVYQPQPLPSLLYRLDPPRPEWLQRVAADEATVAARASRLVLHHAPDASALRFRRRLPPHLVLPEPVDLDAWSWEQLTPRERPVVLVLDAGLPESARAPLLAALEAVPGASIRRLDLPRAAIHLPGDAAPIPLDRWHAGESWSADSRVRRRIAAAAALNDADVVVVPEPPFFGQASPATTCRRWGILQAAACRRPLVVADAPGYPLPAPLAEQLFRFPAGDAEAMAGLVHSLLYHPAKAVQVAERARQRVEASCGAAAFRRRLRALYAGILGTEPDRPLPAPIQPPADP
jgi:glycosyltransferase involved in cell wall biosynthesis